MRGRSIIYIVAQERQTQDLLTQCLTAPVWRLWMQPLHLLSMPRVLMILSSPGVLIHLDSISISNGPFVPRITTSSRFWAGK
jgi:hypothetical protein